jgi:hypothetical protein
MCGKERNVVASGCQVNLSPALLSSLLPLGGSSSSLNVTGNQHKSDYSSQPGGCLLNHTFVQISIENNIFARKWFRAYNGNLVISGSLEILKPPETLVCNKKVKVTKLRT